MSLAALSASGLSIGYPNRLVKQELNFSFTSGQLVCLMGPNGAGKSTLLRTVAGLQPILAGSIKISGTEITALSLQERAKAISLVLTGPPSSNITVYELVALGRQPHTNWFGSLKPADHAIVGRALADVGIGELANRPLANLSDGQRQKALLARALAQQGNLLLLDEPTAHLDLINRIQIMQLLRKIAHTQQKAIIVATHELQLALQTADVLWLMPTRAAKPSYQGLPEDLLLNGSLEKVFKREGYQFNRNTANFEYLQPIKAGLWVEGQGPEIAWLKRALERYGYRINPLSTIHISRYAQAWIVKNGNVVANYNSIEEILKNLPK